jgi:uncharacterized surface protein with fasciclin (FAS1) repeats
MAACLVAASLAGCATGVSTTPATLPPINVPREQPVRGMSLQESEPPVPGSTIVVVNSDSGLDQYPTMQWLLTASGVLDEIGSRPVTIFAPSETAFRDFAAIDHYGLLDNPAAFAPILRRHVVLGVYDSEQLVAAGTVTNLAGEELAVWRNGRILMVNEVAVTVPNTDGVDPRAATLVVYGTDRLLLLPEGIG